MLKVSEIFYSIQGEGTRAGRSCAFVRLAGCNLHCTYCDTRYACEEAGADMSVEDAAGRLSRFPTRLVCITGGEPLTQSETPALARALLEKSCTVLVETNGSYNIDMLPEGVVRIVDAKTPASGMSDHMNWENLKRLRTTDELKIVCCSRADYEWARDLVTRRKLAHVCPVLFSPAHGLLAPARLAEWILEDGLDVRLQLQLHRVIWPRRKRGV